LRQASKNTPNSMITKVVLGVVFGLLSVPLILTSPQNPLNNSLSENENDNESTTMATTTHQLSSLSSSFTSSSLSLTPPTTVTISNSSEETVSTTMTNKIISTITTEVELTTFPSTTTHQHVESVTESVQNFSTTNNSITITLSASNSSIVSNIDNDTTTPSTIKLKPTTVDFQVPENCSDYKVSQMQTDSISLYDLFI
jgi:hypothetical protein